MAKNRLHIVGGARYCVGDVAGERRDRPPAFAEFGLSGVEKAIRAGLLAPDAELDFSAMYPDGPILRGPEAWRG